MPKGKFVSHKGRNRRFTNPEELEEERRKEVEQKKWRKERGISSSEEEEDIAEKGSDEGSSSDDESSTDDEDSPKAKGVSSLIEIENPNRVQKKSKKLATLNTQLPVAEKPQLSRREREEIEKQREQAHYQKLHAEGKTDQARADLARLAIIKQQREEAQKRRELEKKQKEDAAKQKTAQTQKALGKK